MKTPKIYLKGKLASIFLFTGLLIGFLSCDVMEPDADSVKPQVSIDEETIYVFSDGSAFIDLQEKVKTSGLVRLSVTSTPKHGVLHDMGNGLLQYASHVHNQKVLDLFEFTVFSDGNQILTKDTVFISVENDSTKLPCGIYTVDDRVYGVKKNVTYSINPLLNDKICGYDSTEIELSVYHPYDSFPPYNGIAWVKDNTLFYTAGSTFPGSDKLIYRIVPSADPSKAAYGVVYFNGQSSCNFIVNEDVFRVEKDSVDKVMHLPVFVNDILCDNIASHVVSLAQPPKRGTVMLRENVFIYQISDTVTMDPAYFSDFFFYEVCMEDICRSARVDILVRQDSVFHCEAQLQAYPDTMDISGNNISPIYLDVLSNDVICDTLTSFTITESPPYGDAFISTGSGRKTIGYIRNEGEQKNDSLVYKICKKTECSTAKVFIKNE